MSLLEPATRIIAEDLLGEGARVDLVAVDHQGQAVLVLIGEEGEDRALLTRALAQCAWARSRIGDWLKLAPQLDLEAEAGVRGIILSPSYHSDTLLAASSLEVPRISPVVYRCIGDESRTQLLLEATAPPAGWPGDALSRSLGEAVPPFRSGLRESDLRLSPEERRELLAPKPPDLTHR
ncbi:MAG: hypothetical protein JRG96_02045 [Deltaproteobacteria bacterium]|nr:hypothetical protein [Deltaproteobacteria bacterium]MBW2417022.1 hypothetical protein [Deltaproteobacteria bacterium]